MKTMKCSVLSLLAVASFVGPTLVAAEEVAAPSNTFEMSIGAGYAQGFGDVGDNSYRLQDLGKAGGALQLDLGWRITPRWFVGAYGELGRFAAGDAVGSNHGTTAAAGIQGQFHLMPGEQWDPWVGLGFGWRGEWGNFDAGNYSLQGLDLVRFRAGVDYRINRQFSVGPVVGATLTDFLKYEAPGGNGYSDVEGKKLNTYVFAGLAGRFDL